MISRRTFVVGAGLVTAMAARASAQQPASPPRVALVDPGLPVDRIAEGGDAHWDALFRGLRELGHVEDETIAIERWSAAGAMALDQFAAQVVATRPDLIVGFGRFLVEALGRATTTIPIVGIGSFFNVDYARPGGNVTGVDVSGGIPIIAKQLQLLSVSAPGAVRFGYFATRESWEGPFGASAREAAGSLGITLSAVMVEPPVNETTIRAAFAGIAAGEIDALYVGPLSAFNPYNDLIADLALEQRLPAVSAARQQAEAGLLMSYWSDTREMFRRSAQYIARILAGADPGEMAIEQPTVFDFVVNLRTAAALGLTMPPEVLLFATEIIQ